MTFLCFHRSIQCFNGKEWSGFGMCGPGASWEVFRSLKSLSSRSPSDGCCPVDAQVYSLPGWGTHDTWQNFSFRDRCSLETESSSDEFPYAGICGFCICSHLFLLNLLQRKCRTKTKNKSKFLKSVTTTEKRKSMRNNLDS